MRSTAAKMSRHELQAAALPREVLPMPATSALPFDYPGWLFETKWDGVRALVSVANRCWRMWGREGTDYTDRYPDLEALGRLPSGTMLDGELVMVRDGRPDFHALMARHSRRLRRSFRPEPVRYVVFDLLYLRGRCLMDRPLSERRALLHERIPDLPFLRRCEGVVGRGKAFFQQVLAAGHEGIVAKRLSSRYQPNRRGWRKIKQKMELSCVVIGYRSGPGGLRDLLMAALVNGRLAYVGAVELGIPETAAALARLESMRVARPAVACPLTGRWVRAEVFCTVRFCGWRGNVWRDAVVVGWG